MGKEFSTFVKNVNLNIRKEKLLKNAKPGVENIRHVTLK
jgi:hypothetical protein